MVWRTDGSYGGLRDFSTEIVNPPGGGSEGVWIEPLRVLDGLHFFAGSPTDGLERHAVSYRREHGVSEISYRYGPLRLRKRVWVPLHEPAVVVDLLICNPLARPVDLTLLGETRFRLSLGWPLGTTEPPRLSLADASRYVVADNSLGGAVLIASPAPESWWVGKGPSGFARGLGRDRAWWQHNVALAAYGEALIRFVIAAARATNAPPDAVAEAVLDRSDLLLDERIAHLRRCAEAGPRLSTPDPTLDRAFALARPALEDFKHDDPSIGLGYFAGYPAYNFYFAGDAFRTMYGGIPLGDWEDSREILRTIIRGQRQQDDGDQLRGELWHELSTTGHAISPNFVTLELPSILLHYLHWTGDLDFIRETYPAAELAAEWAARKDCDRDGLPDNGPEQTFADAVREDLNVAGAHLTPALWQVRAYRDLGQLARALGERAAARRWRRKASRAARLAERTFWDPAAQHLLETIRPDGTPDTAPGFIPWVEPDDPLDPALIDWSLRNELAEERRLTAGDHHPETGFEQRRQARAYYAIERGDRARRLLLAGWSDDGVRALSSIARLPFRWPQVGFFPEIASLDDVADLRGCFHQGWTPSFGLAWPVIRGLWGTKVDALNDRLSVAPTPREGWSTMSMDNLRIGTHVVALHWSRQAGGQGQVVECHNSGPRLEVTTVLQLPEGTSPISISWLNEGTPPTISLRLYSDAVELTFEVDEAGPIPASSAWWVGPESEGPPGPFSALPRVGLPPRRRPFIAGAGLPGSAPANDSGCCRPDPAEQTPTSARRTLRTGPPHGPPPSCIYLGFLAPPLATHAGESILHLPANYAVRHPDRLLDLLPTIQALVLTDQQDAVLSPELTRAIRSYVQRGGRLLFFCYWSAAWGRGFHHTYSSIARTDLPDLLPLEFADEIRTAAQVELDGPGTQLWSDLPWNSIPPIDYNQATLRPGATLWASAARARTDCLTASWTLGAGQVVAIAADLFGFGHGTLVHWPGQRPLLRQALDWLLGVTRRPPRSPRSRPATPG